MTFEVSLQRSTVLDARDRVRARASVVRVGAAGGVRVRVGISAEHEALNSNIESLWMNTQALYEKTGKNYCNLASPFKTSAAPECNLLIDVKSFRLRLRAANDSIFPMKDSDLEAFSSEYTDLDRRYQAAYEASLPKAPPLPPLKPGEKFPPSEPPFGSPPPSTGGVSAWTVLLVAGVAATAWYLLRGVL